jgi:hypothetical protein
LCHVHRLIDVDSSREEVEGTNKNNATSESDVVRFMFNSHY